MFYWRLYDGIKWHKDFNQFARYILGRKPPKEIFGLYFSLLKISRLGLELVPNVFIYYLQYHDDCMCHSIVKIIVKLNHIVWLVYLQQKQIFSETAIIKSFQLSCIVVWIVQFWLFDKRISNPSRYTVIK